MLSTARIYTAKYLLPIDAPLCQGGALLDLDGRIAAVGSLAELRRSHPGVKVVDFEDAVIAPLLVNAHSHLELTDFPAWAAAADESDDPDNFVDWILRLVRVKRSLTKKAYQQSLANGIEQSLAAGTGAVGDILSQHACRKAFQGSALQGVLYLESLGHDPRIISQARLALHSILAEQQAGQLRLGLSPHSPYTISAAYLQEIYQKCRQQGLPCTTHLAESAAEVDFIAQGSGELANRFYPKVGWEYLRPAATRQRPADYLQEQGGLFADNLLVHGVQLSSSEIELLAKKQMQLALCPRSNARLKVGKAPVTELQAAGVSLCLGTDSMASNDSLSLWDEMAFAHSWFEGALDPPQLLRMATLNGARVLGLADQLGSLSEGKQSSFQVLRPEQAVAPAELYDALLTSGRSPHIEQVYVRGNAQLSGLG